MRPSAAFASDLASDLERAFAADVRAGLSAAPKTLPPRWLYDGLGSSLFDAICRLPWYPITRAELSMLDRIAPEIAHALPGASDVVELGPGNGEKLTRLLTPFARRSLRMTAHLVDVSDEALAAAGRTLSRLARVDVVGHNATFEAGLRTAASAPARGARLVAFLGSNIGNFDPDGAAALLRVIAGVLAPGDGLLLGTDLVKPESVLLSAYDDPLGVTAAFNRNLLVRINRELGADFDLAQFAHEARWNAARSRVEMHLVSTSAQAVRVAGAGLVVRFEPGESIWTESSYKYLPAGVAAMGNAAGLRVIRQWVDDAAGFALTLLAR